MWPFGKEIELGHFGAGGLILNIIWLITFGWGFAIDHFVIGTIFCLTIVGGPFGLQHFERKIAEVIIGEFQNQPVCFALFFFNFSGETRHLLGRFICET